MATSKNAAEAIAALEEAERRDPEAHGYTAEDLQDLAELLQASAGWVQLQAQADRARALVVKLARKITRDCELDDEEATRAAGELALRLLRPAKSSSSP